MIASELGTSWAPNQGLVSVISKNLLSTFTGLRKKSQKSQVLVKSTSSPTAKKALLEKARYCFPTPPLLTQTLLLGLYSLRGQTPGPLYFTNYILRSVLYGSLRITPKTNAVLTMNTSDDLSQATLHSWIIPLLLSSIAFYSKDESFLQSGFTEHVLMPLTVHGDIWGAVAAKSGGLFLCSINSRWLINDGPTALFLKNLSKKNFPKRQEGISQEI